MLGKRPYGIIITPTSRRSDYKDAEILDYIAKRGGEYDEVEHICLSDPWIDGYELCEQGVLLGDIQVSKDKIHRSVYLERLKLTKKGWHDCKADMKRAKQCH